MTIEPLRIATLERRTLSDDAYDGLVELLFDQRIPPGERLSIDGLARVLQISQTPIREALARLEAEGLVIKEPLRGYTATPRLDRAGFAHLYEARLALEPRAARLAAERVDGDALQELEQLSRRLRSATTGGLYREFKAFASHDAAFHLAVARASQNPYLHDAVARLRSHLHLSRLYFQHGIVDAAEAVPEHDALIDALRRKDADGAEHCMGYHIARSRARLAPLVG